MYDQCYNIEGTVELQGLELDWSHQEHLQQVGKLSCQKYSRLPKRQYEAGNDQEAFQLSFVISLTLLALQYHMLKQKLQFKPRLLHSGPSICSFSLKVYKGGFRTMEHLMMPVLTFQGIQFGKCCNRELPHNIVSPNSTNAF